MLKIHLDNDKYGTNNWDSACCFDTYTTENNSVVVPYMPKYAKDIKLHNIHWESYAVLQEI